MYNESNYMYLRLPITLVSHRATTVRKVIIAYRSTSPHTREVSFIKNSENELFVWLFVVAAAASYMFILKP